MEGFYFVETDNTFTTPTGRAFVFVHPVNGTNITDNNPNVGTSSDPPLNALNDFLASQPLDTDGDGIADSSDLDDDNDGILDTVEQAACTPSSTSCDTDADGVPNHLDLDSDGDGINDVREANGTDTNGDGKVDGGVDSNGVPTAASGGYTPPNTDSTGGTDPYDTDSDGDGILDSVEKGANGNAPVDTDNDGTPDYRDLDSDNDGISDATEKGTGSTPVDTDNDGTPDYRDLDSDNDGISDATERGTGASIADTDGDGIPDYRELDSDNDGIPDNTEGTADCDNDGVPNLTDPDPCKVDILLPKAFTPNGDGINDEIKPVLLGIDNFGCFKVYDRWGNVVFETKDRNQGWDGAYREKKQGTESFIWQAEGYDRNGNLVKRAGMFTLIR